MPQTQAKTRKKIPPGFFLFPVFPEMEPSIKNGAAGRYYNQCRKDSLPESVLHSLSNDAEVFTKFPLSILTFVKDCNFSGC